MDSSIKVTKTNETPELFEFKVAVQDTGFSVRLRRDYYQELTAGQTSPEELVRASFRFLLDNEPVTSILSEFSLSDIEIYFPKFPQEITDYISE